MWQCIAQHCLQRRMVNTAVIGGQGTGYCRLSTHDMEAEQTRFISVSARASFIAYPIKVSTTIPTCMGRVARRSCYLVMKLGPLAAAQTVAVVPRFRGPSTLLRHVGLCV